MEENTMNRPAWVWLSGPLVGVVAMIGITVGGKVTGTTSTLAFFAPFIAMPIAWMAWWPFLKPKMGFWFHTAVGFVVSALVMAVRIVIGGV